MNQRLTMAAAPVLILACGCFSEKTPQGFCEAACRTLWTPECAVRCDQPRPAGCTEDRCPIAVADASLADGGAGQVDAASDAGPEAACGASCPRATPICDEARERCVECLRDAHCSAAQAGRCVDGACVECEVSADCADPGAARCDMAEHVCAGCEADDDCAGVVGESGEARAVCDPSDGACVECTGDRYEACGTTMEAQDGAVTELSLVCNSETRRCATRKAGETEVCGECITDAQCEPGARCVREEFGGATLDYVCLWVIEGEPGTASCGSRYGQYSLLRSDVASKDAQGLTVCQLRATTCHANKEFLGNVEVGIGEGCSPAEVEQDACGRVDAADTLCAEQALNSDSAPQPYCTPRCQDATDCVPGHACSTGGTCFLDENACSDLGDCDPGQTCTLCQEDGEFCTCE